MSFAEVKPNPYLDKFYKGLDELAFGKDFMPTGLTSRPNMSYEECQASRDPRVLSMGDPCGGLPHSSFSDVQVEAEVSPAVSPLSFLEAFIQQSPDIAGSPSFDLSYPHIPGRNLEGVPNANDPVMREKLRRRLLKNPGIDPRSGQQLPEFLIRGV